MTKFIVTHKPFDIQIDPYVKEQYTVLSPKGVTVENWSNIIYFESELDKCCDYVIALIADEELKIRRICKRDNIDEQTAKSRLNIQNEDEFFSDFHPT